MPFEARAIPQRADIDGQRRAGVRRRRLAVRRGLRCQRASHPDGAARDRAEQVPLAVAARVEGGLARARPQRVDELTRANPRTRRPRARSPRRRSRAPPARARPARAPRRSRSPTAGRARPASPRAAPTRRRRRSRPRRGRRTAPRPRPSCAPAPAASCSARSRCSAPADGIASSFASAPGQPSAPASSAIGETSQSAASSVSFASAGSSANSASSTARWRCAVADRHRHRRLDDQHEVRRADRARLAHHHLLERIARRPPREHLVRIGRRRSRSASPRAAATLRPSTLTDARPTMRSRSATIGTRYWTRPVGLGRGLDPFQLEAARPVLLQREDRHRDPARPVPGHQRGIAPARDDRRVDVRARAGARRTRRASACRSPTRPRRSPPRRAARAGGSPPRIALRRRSRPPSSGASGRCRAAW